jgi:hypothetical protein
MKLSNSAPAHQLPETNSKLSEMPIAQLVAQVYEAVPVPEKVHLIEHLLRPLGVLALVGVAHGVFARIWFRNPMQVLQILPEDALNVSGTDVSALVDFVQQVNVEAVDGLAQLLASSPAVAGSATLALLVAMLMKRIKTRRGDGPMHVSGRYPQVREN